MRNPVLEFHNVSFKFIGDPHLGRIFKRNIPVSKLGLREKSILEDFEKHLKEGNGKDFTVIVGDIFDSFKISNEALIAAKNILVKFITDKKYKTRLVLIPGNHDLSKDRSKVSSYSVLASLLEPYTDDKKFTLVDITPKLIEYQGISIYLDSYDPFYKSDVNSTSTTTNLINSLNSDVPLISIGHWDDPRFEKGYLPPEDLVKRSEKLVSGHIHIPETFTYLGGNYVYTGSLQPYSHGEDPDSILYSTYTYEEIESILKSDVRLEEENILNKNIRVNCYPGYYLPMPVNCMSLSYNPVLEYPESKKELEDKLDYEEDIEDLDLADFNTMFLLTLKMDYEVEEELLIKLNNFLKNDDIKEFKL